MSHDYSYAIGAASGRIHRRNEPGFNDTRLRWLEGTVLTPWGIVAVYSQGHDGGRQHSSYTLAHDGRVYQRSEDLARPERGLARKAAEFAREIVVGVPA